MWEAECRVAGEGPGRDPRGAQSPSRGCGRERGASPARTRPGSTSGAAGRGHGSPRVPGGGPPTVGAQELRSCPARPVTGADRVHPDGTLFTRSAFVCAHRALDTRWGGFRCRNKRQVEIQTTRRNQETECVRVARPPRPTRGETGGELPAPPGRTGAAEGRLRSIFLVHIFNDCQIGSWFLKILKTVLRMLHFKIKCIQLLILMAGFH